MITLQFRSTSFPEKLQVPAFLIKQKQSRDALRAELNVRPERAFGMSGPVIDAGGLLKGAAAVGSRARRKLLTTEEAELFELAQAAGSGIDPEVFKILLDLLRMNVAPLAVFQMLRSMCAGQRLVSTEVTPDTARGRARTISTVAGNQAVSDHGNREGSGQRVPRQPSASRLQKTGCPVKNT